MSGTLKFAFSTDSLLYSYYMFIRRVYGRKPVLRTNLCPAFWTVVLGSVGILVLWPFMIVGWITSKVAAKWMAAESKLSTRVMKSDFGQVMSEAADSFVLSPLLFGSLFGAGAILSIGAMAMFLYTIVVAGWHMSFILEATSQFFCTMGWVVFWFCHGIGFVLTKSWSGISWFFTNGDLWSTILTLVGITMASVAVVAIIAVIIGYLVMSGLNTGFIKKLRADRAIRLKAAALAREQRAEALRKAGQWTCKSCSFKNNSECRYCVECLADRVVATPKVAAWRLCFSRFFERIFETFNGSTKRIGSGSVHVLGFFSMLSAFLMARKAKMCPSIYFVSSADLQKQVDDADQEWKEKNNRLADVMEAIDLKLKIRACEDDEGNSEMDDTRMRIAALKARLGDDHPAFV